MFVHFKEIPKLWKSAKVDLVKNNQKKTLNLVIKKFNSVKFLKLIWIVSFVAVVTLDVTWGLAVSVGFALFTLIVRSQWYY